MNVTTPKGETCFVIFKNDYSGYTKAYLLKNKGEAAAKSIIFVAWLERQTGNKVITFRSDGGVEYMKNKEFREKNGIVQQVSNRYTPQENSRSEREMRRIMEPTRKVIHMTMDSSVVKDKRSGRVLELWGEFLLSTVHVLNRTISSRSNKTPYELFFKKKPSVDYFRVIGCRAYFHIPDQLRKKLDAKAKPG